MVNWYKIPEHAKLKPFTFIVGGYGIGKTYSAIDRALTEYKGHFLYLRNTDVQISECCGSFGNPFKKWAADHNANIFMKREIEHAVVYEEIEHKREIIGYGAALSTFENLRSIDLSNIRFIIFEEFIENRILMFDQFKGFTRMYETVNRNREIFGEDPVYVVLLSNAQRLGNPILRGYNLIPLIESMQKSGQKTTVCNNGQVRIELPFSEVSEAKKTTALYLATQGANFHQEAINNNFVNDSFTGVKKVNIAEYTPMVRIDDIYIYKHKSEQFYYACAIPAQKIKTYRSRDNFLIFNRIYGVALKLAYGQDRLFFSDYSTKVDLLGLLKMLY